MKESGPSKPNLTKKEIEDIRETFQAREETGISSDYFNEGVALMMNVKTILGKPGFDLLNKSKSKKENTKLKEEIFESIEEDMKKFRSYSEYMAQKRKIKGMGLFDFLNEKGKQAVKELDKIAEQIKGLVVEDPKMIDLEKLLDLLEKFKQLIYQRE